MEIFLVDSLITLHEISFALPPEISKRERLHFPQLRCQRLWWQELETKGAPYQNLILLPISVPIPRCIFIFSGTAAQRGYGLLVHEVP
jgi:hypothetical protein